MLERLLQDVLNDVAVDVRQSESTSLELVRETLMINSHLVQDRGL